jgi:hypothetical protein
MMESSSELQKMYNEHRKMKEALTEIIAFKEVEVDPHFDEDTANDLLTIMMSMVEIAEDALK